jgi:hypothetical protein
MSEGKMEGYSGFYSGFKGRRSQKSLCGRKHEDCRGTETKERKQKKKTKAYK